MRKPRIPYFVCLGVILLLLGIWASFDEPYTTLDGITDKETIKKISNCEKSKFGSNYENIILTGNYDIDWSNCDLSNVVLRYTQLNNANLNGVNLSGADLTGAELIGAELIGAELFGVS